jgi:hypothetical protein
MDPVSPEWELVISAEEDIVAADYIQHAIVTFEGMEGALARLTAKGLLTVSDHGLAPGDKTLVFYRSSKRRAERSMKRKRTCESSLTRVVGAQSRGRSMPTLVCRFVR